jgi:hypothetical protein
MSVFAVIVIDLLSFALTGNIRDYAKAQDLMEQGKYKEAISAFEKLEGYTQRHL